MALARPVADMVWHVYRWKKQEETPVASETASPVRPGAKNRPTPSRREAEAARRRPIVPADREAAKKESRQKERAERARYREGMYRGEQWALGPRDRGPQRQLIRDIIDSRWNIGEFLLPVMIVALPLSLLRYSWAYTAGFAVLYGMMIVTILDTVFLSRRIKKEISERLGEEPSRGTFWYVFSRSVQMRPGRVPRPRVTRKGERVTPQAPRA